MSEFPAEGVAFLKALAENNNKEWFAANKGEYEKFVKAPGEAVCADLLSGLTSSVGPLKAKLFRIYRDVRFSKDKSPYNPYLRMSFGNCEGSAHGTLALFCGVEDGQAIVGTGVFEFSSDVLERFRARVSEVDGLLASVAPVRVPDPELARVPRGFAADSPAHVRRKGLTVWRDIPAEGGVSSEELLRELTAVVPVYRWLEGLSS